MTRYLRPLAIAALAATLGGCAGAAVPRPTAPAARPVPPPTPPRITQNNSLVGHAANAALSLFGKPRLDVSEGMGRKLQFAGSPCILDIYYYAPKQGAEPIATYVDARTPDGRDANVDSCITALRR
ncbi:hypothetical protein CVO77_10820 [Sphingopyxis lindanitolerans]|uniref:Uncharacterized protein n=1 Tax=Sphingopyxis lindanitolerans TaxID=2054227 RepID=A0A2S8B975_9SPHN|nr:hypothetical protein [Sphingopyxis lindanitolerans]PQM28897.1 hypothetical protein CVO77_10820 [Sphingopyxis lindanitolerans]